MISGRCRRRNRRNTKRNPIEGGLPDKKGNPANDHINAHWRVENGELVNDGHGLYLTTDKDYGDFELLLEYKALPDGDSGVYLRGIPQVQIWDSTKGDPRGLGQDKGSGGLWNNSKGAPGKDPSKKMDKPFGEWNTFKIRMIGERVTVVFNGETVVDNCVLENFFANKKAGYLAYGKQPAKDASAEDENAEWLHARSGLSERPDPTADARQRDPLAEHLHPRDHPGGSEQGTALARRDDGFVELVNGKDLSNWQNAVDSYEMKDGAIVCRPGKGGHLLTKEEYEDCIIKVEFKLPHAGNNGIALRTPLGGHPVIRRIRDPGPRQRRLQRQDRQGSPARSLPISRLALSLRRREARLPAPRWHLELRGDRSARPEDQGHAQRHEDPRRGLRHLRPQPDRAPAEGTRSPQGLHWIRRPQRSRGIPQLPGKAVKLRPGARAFSIY